jgi:putative hydrolase of the HAD superfamily
MKYKLITFDLDDTFWDIAPVIIKAEKDTRAWLRKTVGEIEWGSMSDFMGIREDLIKVMPSLEWDIGLLRKEIYKQKLKNIVPNESERNELINTAYSMFLEKRHEVIFYDGVYDAIEKLSKKYYLGILTNGNADIFKYDIGRFFNFSISSFDVQDNKPNKPHFESAKNKYENISYEEIIHIGDHQINDVYGAYQLGMKAIWFNNMNNEWDQSFDKPDEFSHWNDCTKLIEEIDER